jgi:hypothetical protein
MAGPWPPARLSGSLLSGCHFYGCAVTGSVLQPGMVGLLYGVAPGVARSGQARGFQDFLSRHQIALGTLQGHRHTFTEADDGTEF